MVFYCCAYNCKNNTRDKSLAFHSFPLGDAKMLKEWLRNMKWKDWTPEEHHRICSSHFEKRCYSNREGQRPRLHPWAAPTIFSFPEHMHSRKRKIDPRSKRALGTIDESVLALPTRTQRRSSQSTMRPVVYSVPIPAKTVIVTDSRPLTAQTHPVPVVQQGAAQPQQVFTYGREKVDKRASTWTILGDESVERNVTIPSFFHSSYCLPRSLRWDGDVDLNAMPNIVNGVMGQTEPHIIEVKEKWEWLGIDIRGPLPITTNKHTHIMTLTDYYSKWVEAFPLTDNYIRDAALCLSEVIVQQGYPLAVLSRFPKRLLMEINRDLKKFLKINTSSLVIHHRQTGYLDVVTESLLNDMVSTLVKEHPDTWHIHLPAASLRLCCTEHLSTGVKPFILMSTHNQQAFSSPREMPYSAADIRLSSFVVVSSGSDKENTPNLESELQAITVVLPTSYED